MKSKRVEIVRIEPTNFYIITEVEQHKPIGFCGIKKGELIGLFIEPKYRRKGYASDVIQTLREEMSITVVTSPKNIPMQKLLEKLGFEKWLKYEGKKIGKDRDRRKTFKS